METKYFSLGPVETSVFVRIIRIVFGVLCMSIALYWLYFNVMSVKASGTIWVTVLFLSGFGLYQVWAGIGRASQFIEIGREKILLKKSPLLPVKVMGSFEIRKIEVYPLNLIFYFHRGGRTILRFGTTYTDVIDPVKKEIESFAEHNKIELETIMEEI